MKVKPAIISLIFFSLTVLAVELYLRHYLPFNYQTLGSPYNKNAQRWGWGYAPHDVIKTGDPDTGISYTSRTNNLGFRDRDRTYVNSKNAYRILFLGDSVTFGPLVPDEKTVTRLLEALLLEEGYNVEVLNLSCGGLGTDQELELLKSEGVKFKPNLVILQFTTNDFSDNNFQYHVNEWDEEARKAKPFYYRIDEKGLLRREKNPYYIYETKNLKGFVRELFDKSEISKRFYALVMGYRRPDFSFKKSEISKEKLPEIKYKFTRKKIEILKHLVDLKEESPLGKYLFSRIDQPLNLKKLNELLIESPQYSEKAEVILRILEDQPMHEIWDQQVYDGQPMDENVYEWRLFIALVEEIQRVTESIGATLAVFPETEEGFYDWSRYWYLVEDSAVAKAGLLRYRELMTSVLPSKNIPLIKNTRPYERSRVDAHPTAKGYEAMAQDTFDFLMQYKKGEMELFRKL